MLISQAIKAYVQVLHQVLFALSSASLVSKRQAMPSVASANGHMPAVILLLVTSLRTLPKPARDIRQLALEHHLGSHVETSSAMMVTRSQMNYFVLKVSSTLPSACHHLAK
jgi:hypothetical protein